ncbi:COP9 signalosome complex subunit 1 [Actinomortierella ambigua]|uniref:COP9 signalosome complex subunit 1 n=1 Tax=Actinomortierella ambigua TaxID=1343610 RepID=A0A9P6Q9S3_9FUNG|nr:COP9 signalosome complex subunit 1 [Actinomortierella ambigua]
MSPDSGMMDTTPDHTHQFGIDDEDIADVEHADVSQGAAGTPSSASGATMPGQQATAATSEGDDDNADTTPSSHATSKRKRFVKVVEVEVPNNLDLDAYIANYKGHTKVNRLEFIAERCPSLQLEALRLAILELRKTNSLNVLRYVNLVQKLQDAAKGVSSSTLAGAGITPDLLMIDKGWVDAQALAAKQRTETLETELKNYKRNSIKESIRMANNELGDHYYACGDLTAAHRSYSRTRDYCATSKHIIDMCMNVIKVSIELGNFPHVLTLIVKADTTPDVQKDKEVIKSKLKAASGLANLDLNKYKLAARDFLTIGEELVGQQYSEVISANDIAVYGGLCALASFTRQELKTLVLDNVGFRQFLELEPHIRDLIQGFYNSNYAQCLEIMDKWKNDYLLDVHLHSHIQTLFGSIRRKALVQFASTFLTVDLTKMAKSFSTTVPELEQELVPLITSRQIEARIDSQQKILWAKRANKRSAIYERAHAMGQEYEREAKVLVLRMQLVNHNLIVKSSPSSGAGGPGLGAGLDPEGGANPMFGGPPPTRFAQSRLDSPLIAEFLATLVGENNKVMQPEIKAFKNVIYHAYKPLGVSLHLLPGEEPVLDALHLYRAPSDRFASFPKDFVVRRRCAGTTAAQASFEGETVATLNVDMKGHELLAKLGEPEKKEGGGRLSNCWIGYEDKFGISIEFVGSSWDDGEMPMSCLTLGR